MLFLFILKQLLFYFSFVNFNFILKLHDFAYLKVDIVFGCEFVNSNAMVTSSHKSHVIQWNLVIKRSDITKPSYNKVILLVPALYIS